jgi:hypothetical protein
VCLSGKAPLFYSGEPRGEAEFYLLKTWRKSVCT